jgi:hypothetical protein
MKRKRKDKKRKRKETKNKKKRKEKDNKKKREGMEKRDGGKKWKFDHILGIRSGHPMTQTPQKISESKSKPKKCEGTTKAKPN